jgi:putative nucleotidyltransferase with HDIG domain
MQSHRLFELAWMLVRCSGMQDADWDPWPESQATLRDLTLLGSLDLPQDRLPDATRARIDLSTFRPNASLPCYTIRSVWGNRMPSREDAWKLLCEYTASESLRKHMLAVEACVRSYARKAGADEETWGLAALLHDFDYERWPNHEHSPDQGHPSDGARILREQGYSEEIVRAILSHADYCNVPRQSALEHTLFACDELAGFLTACAYVRPSKSILDLEVDSVKRRMKDKLFAKGVSRDDVRKGGEELGIPLEEHIAFCIGAMREHADVLGLRGTL